MTLGPELVYPITAFDPERPCLNALIGHGYSRGFAVGLPANFLTRARGVDRAAKSGVGSASRRERHDEDQLGGPRRVSDRDRNGIVVRPYIGGVHVPQRQKHRRETAAHSRTGHGRGARGRVSSWPLRIEVKPICRCGGRKTSSNWDNRGLIGEQHA